MPLILGTNSIKDTGYEVANSCRFNDDDSAYMHVTRGSAGNQKTFTVSMWIKRCELGASNYFFTVGPDGDTNFVMYFDSADRLEVWQYSSAAYQFRLKPTRVFRDVSAWYHLCVAIDTTDATADDRVKIYINGVQETTMTTRTNPSEDLDTVMNDDRKYWLGKYVDSSNYFDGYIAELVVIDGSALAPTSFGEFDEDSPTIWKPIDVSGLTFGTNGFYLDFEDSANLGNDANGGTDLTEVNLAATDQATDTPTNNFCTLNPLLVPLSYIPTYAEGNTKISAQSNSGRFQSISTIGMTAGKWYAEFRIDSSQYHTLGVATEKSFTSASTLIQDSNNYLGGSNTHSYIYYCSDGEPWSNGTVSSGYGDSLTSAGDILGVAIDITNSKIYYSKNGTWQNSGDPESGATGTGAVSIASGETYFFAVGDLATGSFSGTSCNFGNPAFAISSGNADGNGYGNFEYAVPSGYLALCTKNLGSDGG